MSQFEYSLPGQRQREMLLQGIEELGLSLDKNAFEIIMMHLGLVYRWRSKMNLVSIRNERELISHHALDSLALLSFLKQSRLLLDIGTGAGFPGIILAAAHPAAQFCLLDSRRRRIEFLRMANAQLGLQNVNFTCARVETLNPVNDSDVPNSSVQTCVKFDTLVARAVASLDQLMKMTISLRSAGQRLIAMKGRYPEQELKVLDEFHGDRIASVRIESIKVPFLEAERHAVIIDCL